jgi:hypothetical protein
MFYHPAGRAARSGRACVTGDIMIVGKTGKHPGQGVEKGLKEERME